MTDAQCLALAQSIRTILAELAERSSAALKNDTLRKAQKDLGVVANKVAFSGRWMWSIPLPKSSR
jgi:hypothetical protein